MKTILCLAFFGLICGLALAANPTLSSVSATSASFNSAPVKVFDYSNSTTGTPDATITATSIWISGVVFGAGTKNDTIYAYALKYNPLGAATSPGLLTAVLRRTINATQAAMGTDTKEDSVQMADATIAITSTNKLLQNPLLATAPGYFALAANAPGTTYPASTDMLMVWIVAAAGTSATAVTVDTSVTVSAAASNTATYPTFAVAALWAEDSVFYVLYETQTQTGTSAAMTAFAPASAKQTGLNLQGVNATSGKTMYTAAVAILTAQTFTTTQYNMAILNAMGAGTNSSMSPTIQVLWKDPSVSKVMFAAVTKTSGALATSATAVSAADATYMAGPPIVPSYSFMPGGFLSSNYSYGIVISNNSQTGASSYVNGANADFNGTTTAGGTFQLGTNTVQGSTVTVKGYPYGTGFAAITITTPSSGTTGPSYAWQAYFANNTMNGTSVAIGSSQAPVSVFMDANGALWVGYYTYDTTTPASAVNGPTTGYVGRLVAQTNYYNSTGKSANVLATFAAILSFVIASLFMF